jgi:hypothetical protein
MQRVKPVNRRDAEDAEGYAEMEIRHHSKGKSTKQK